VPDATGTHAPSLHPASGPGYTPKAPLWKSRRGLIPVRGVVLGSFATAFFVCALTWPWLERHVLIAAPASAVVRVVRVEGTTPGDEEQLTTFRYIVALPDGTEARLVSERTYRVGTRLAVITSRSRVTGRVFVAGPYTSLSE
jgi:hypothetical protein